MAPPLQYINFRKVVLSFSLLVSSFLASSSLFVSALSEPYTQQTQIYSSKINLGRRTLLGKTSLDFDDGDEESASVSPKKKKTQKPNQDEEDEDTLATSSKKKKKVQKSDVEEDEEASLSPKKKKKVVVLKSDDGEEEALESPKKKKKVVSDDAEETLVSPKKKKVVSDDAEEALLSPKKKKKQEKNDEKEEETPVSPKKKKQLQKADKDDTDYEGSALSKKKKAEIEEDEEEEREKSPKKTKSPSSISSKTNQTKLNKPSNSSPSTKNQPKLIKPLTSTSKNKTKLIKTSSKVAEEDPTSTPTLTKTKLKKLNSTTTTTTTSSTTDKKPSPEPSKPKPKPKTVGGTDKTTKQKHPPSPPSWAYQEDDTDTDIEGLVSEFRDLPTRFHDTFVPDLHRISATSKIYLTKANKEMARGFKPYVGNKYAPSVATAICFAFVVVPFLLVSLLFSKIKAYFSLQRLLILVQIYLSIYFSILCLSSLLTGLEPLRFFYATSRHTYVWLQVLQTLGYVLYLLMLLMYLVLVFSTDTGLAHKFLGLAQTFVGFAVGLHYYMTVFHRVVLRQPPKTNWKVHGIYATCFLAICLLARAERRKKAYLQEGGEEGKIN